MTCGWSTRPRSSVGARRETAKRSDLAGWAEYGYCASHSRFFWGLRLHLVCTLSGLPVAFALAGAKADEREVLLGMLDADPNLVAAHPNQKLMADKNYYGKAFEGALADAEVELLRPARKGENPRPGRRYFKPFRQVIESINNTLKTQLDLERHGGRTIDADVVRPRARQKAGAQAAAVREQFRPAADSREVRGDNNLIRSRLGQRDGGDSDLTRACELDSGGGRRHHLLIMAAGEQAKRHVARVLHAH